MNRRELLGTGLMSFAMTASGASLNLAKAETSPEKKPN